MSHYTIAVNQGTMTLPRPIQAELNMEDEAVLTAVRIGNRIMLTPLLTIEQTAKRIGVTLRAVERWVERGSLDSVQTVNGVMIPVDALAEHDELNGILQALDEDRPPATESEIERILAPERANWTWIGKEA